LICFTAHAVRKTFFSGGLFWHNQCLFYVLRSPDAAKSYRNPNPDPAAENQHIMLLADADSLSDIYMPWLGL
jgi:hypothetical protein